MQTLAGSCHCGAVRFEADLDLTQPSFRCNCTICRRTPSSFIKLQAMMQPTSTSQVASTHKWITHHHQY